MKRAIPECSGVDLDESEVGRDLVSDGDLHDVSGHHLDGLDLLDALLVGPVTKWVKTSVSDPDPVGSDHWPGSGSGFRKR